LEIDGQPTEQRKGKQAINTSHSQVGTQIGLDASDLCKVDGKINLKCIEIFATSVSGQKKRPVSPDNCRVLSVTLKNDALKFQPLINGTYFLSDIVNAKPSWKHKVNSKAIWYVPEYDDWAIGFLKKLGTTYRGLTSTNDQGSLDIFNVPSGKWKFYNNDDQIWTKAGKTDVTIQCITKPL
jgi:hypothetical protein